MTLLRAACLALVLSGCGAPMLVGEAQPGQLTTFDEKWKAAAAAAQPDPGQARALAEVPPGGEVLVVLGTWCGDSRREVSRFVKALELAGPVPFRVRWVGVDRKKQAPGLDARSLEIRYVPTFIVSRGGNEIGRVVESSPGGIEADLGALLREERRGVITARPAEASIP